MKDRTLSLSDLLHVFYPETKEIDISSDEYKVLFIFDGLDECRLSLDFQSDVRLCDSLLRSPLHHVPHPSVLLDLSHTVLEKMFSEAESGEIPRLSLQMYTHFLILQTNIKQEKDYEKKVKDEDMIVKLGKLAFQQLVKGNLIFYEEDLRECGIDETEASVYSGLCTQIFREELGLYQGKVFCFVHLSIQEHLAALYAHHCFKKTCINVFEQTEQSCKVVTQKEKKLFGLHQRAVDEALQSMNGHLDLFLRFFLGLSLKFSQTLLRELPTQTGAAPITKRKQFSTSKRRSGRIPLQRDPSICSTV
ncbi:uncharacterized protein LOC122140852 [Cyprinus carpio]|uniref:Uncharacterized protein LOC122140852 n=1 Tax=Cyprinus carpio TaxID=7962 RepID=A0A9Q9XHI4_CYPCA|nr:uncharacterized protein LOC122140852 [Cyprinus carpio]